VSGHRTRHHKKKLLYGTGFFNNIKPEKNTIIKSFYKAMGRRLRSLVQEPATFFVTTSTLNNRRLFNYASHLESESSLESNLIIFIIIRSKPVCRLTPKVGHIQALKHGQNGNRIFWYLIQVNFEFVVSGTVIRHHFIYFIAENSIVCFEFT